MLKKLLIGLSLLSLTVFLTGCTLPGRKKSALSVSTTPQATIFLDGEHLGQTPYYNEKLKPGDYVLKIVPESSGQALNPWEGRVTLSPGILTVVNRELGLTQDSSSGEVLSFEPSADKKATSISVVTTPDGAVVNLDGEPKGFAPISLDNTTEGDHILLISSPGYQDKTIKAKTVKGNKLIVSVQLARAVAVPIVDDEPQQEATPAASPKASPKTGSAATPAKPYVTIDSPDTGWVRVRAEASTASEELTKVDHGESFPLVDEQSGWYQIEYATGKNGWISGKYAEKFE
ncbi:PEGA domain-containing protein [Patescibacteria group bacterium]|nr:PEGA domain-containing protein [Patescibacteria group bacterium]MBU1500109.1 PEGA domain-containing protein [Patescibacteria group bacterium]